MLNIENLTDYSINVKLLETIANSLTSREIDLTLCYNNTIQEYNKEYRQKDKATDVLSFPIDNDIIIDDDLMPLGAIVISINFVMDKAEEYKHSAESEMALLFIHGLLHLLGYNHIKDDEAETMENLEIKLLDKLNIVNPYLEIEN